jgi:hypothetical protein
MSIGKLSLQLSATSDVFRRDLDKADDAVDSFAKSAGQKIDAGLGGKTGSGLGGRLAAKTAGGMGLGRTLVGAGVATAAAYGAFNAAKTASPASADRFQRQLDDVWAAIGKNFVPFLNLASRGLEAFNSVLTVAGNALKPLFDTTASALEKLFGLGNTATPEMKGKFYRSDGLWSIGDTKPYRRGEDLSDLDIRTGAYKEVTKKEFDEAGKRGEVSGRWGGEHTTAPRPAQFASAEELSRKNILSAYSAGNMDVPTEQLDQLKELVKLAQESQLFDEQTTRQWAINRGLDGFAGGM